jgi:methionine sulfoxide reductase heme-binding subunit
MFTLPPDVDDIRLLIRITARSSMLLFLLAFTASAMATLWPSARSRWVRRHRRQIGLMFFGSHVLHATAIGALAVWAAPELFAQLTPLPSRVLGGAGYVALILMAATSNDRAVAWLGRARWQQLHTWGTHLIWLVFAMACLKRIPMQPVYAVPLVVLLMAMGLRWLARRQQATQAQVQAVPLPLIKASMTPAPVPPSGSSS